MLPWPVWGLILNYANDWKLNRVCKKFKFYVEKQFRFKFSDFNAIVEKCNKNMLKKYFGQYGKIKTNYYSRITTYRDYRSIIFLLKNGYGDPLNLLSKACQHGDVELTKYILNNYDSNIHNLVYIGFSSKFPEIVDLFRKYETPENIDFRINGFCVSGNYDEFIKIANKNGNHFSSACRGGNIKIINYFIENNINNYWDGIRGAFSSGKIEIVKLFEPFEFIVGLNYYFINACISGNVEFAEYVLKKTRILPLQPDFEAAIYSGDLQMVKLLYRSDFSNFTSGFSFVCSEGFLDILKFLVSKGERPSNDDLLQSCEKARLNIFKYLVEELNFEISPKLIKKTCEFGSHNICEYLGTKECPALKIFQN